jgi:hypothetical protein
MTSQEKGQLNNALADLAALKTEPAAYRRIAAKMIGVTEEEYDDLADIFKRSDEVLKAIEAFDFSFATAIDNLPDGSRRGDYRYHSVDRCGDAEKARCPHEATFRVRVTERRGRSGDHTYEARICNRCAAYSQLPPDELDMEIWGGKECTVEILEELGPPRRK